MKLIISLPSGEAAPGSPFRVTSAVERVRIINACLNDLTDRQRAVIALHYGVEMPGEKIGRLLGITAPGVADLHQRALAALRRGLAARGIGRWDEL